MPTVTDWPGSMLPVLAGTPIRGNAPSAYEGGIKRVKRGPVKEVESFMDNAQLGTASQATVTVSFSQSYGYSLAACDRHTSHRDPSKTGALYGSLFIDDSMPVCCLIGRIPLALYFTKTNAHIRSQALEGQHNRFLA